MLILALGLLAVCFAEEGQPSGHELDKAKSFIKQIQVSTKPLAKMLPLEKDAEKQMSGVIAALKPVDGSRKQAKAADADDGKADAANAGDEAGGHQEELGEALEAHAIADVASTALNEIGAAKDDETKQQSAAKLAMKRIDATLASMKRAGISSAAHTANT